MAYYDDVMRMEDEERRRKMREAMTAPGPSRYNLGAETGRSGIRPPAPEGINPVRGPGMTGYPAIQDDAARRAATRQMLEAGPSAYAAGVMAGSGRNPFTPIPSGMTTPVQPARMPMLRGTNEPYRMPNEQMPWTGEEKYGARYRGTDEGISTNLFNPVTLRRQAEMRMRSAGEERMRQAANKTGIEIARAQGEALANAKATEWGTRMDIANTAAGARLQAKKDELEYKDRKDLADREMKKQELNLRNTLGSDTNKAKEQLKIMENENNLEVQRLKNEGNEIAAKARQDSFNEMMSRLTSGDKGTTPNTPAVTPTTAAPTASTAPESLPILTPEEAARHPEIKRYKTTDGRTLTRT